MHKHSHDKLTSSSSSSSNSSSSSSYSMPARLHSSIFCNLSNACAHCLWPWRRNQGRKMSLLSRHCFVWPCYCAPWQVACNVCVVMQRTEMRFRLRMTTVCRFHALVIILTIIYVHIRYTHAKQTQQKHTYTNTNTGIHTAVLATCVGVRRALFLTNMSPPKSMILWHASNWRAAIEIGQIHTHGGLFWIFLSFWNIFDAKHSLYIAFLNIFDARRSLQLFF